MAMMTSIRNRSHVFLWALLFLFLLSMSVGGLVGGANIIDQLLGRVNPAEAIGSVNGDKITPDQFNQAVTARLRAIQDSGTEISDQYLETIRQQVWNAFIEERLTKQAIEDFTNAININSNWGDDKKSMLSLAFYARAYQKIILKGFL